MSNTVGAIVDSAQLLLQTRGYHAFSFRDIATRVGIRTASIHYHFPTKEHLALAVAEKVLAEFKQATAAIAAKGLSAPERLQSFALLFQATTRDTDRLCPICMLATGQDAIPPALAAAVREFWLFSEMWLRDVFSAGQLAGHLRFEAEPEVLARVWLATIEGSMITARAWRDPTRLASAVDYLLRQLRVDVGPGQ